VRVFLTPLKKMTKLKLQFQGASSRRVPAARSTLHASAARGRREGRDEDVEEKHHHGGRVRDSCRQHRGKQRPRVAVWSLGHLRGQTLLPIHESFAGEMSQKINSWDDVSSGGQEV
jgi:hypothetical protein